MSLLSKSVWLFTLTCCVAQAAPPRDGLLIGGADPTIVATKDSLGQVVYVVAATGRGVQLVRSTDLEHWESMGSVFDRPVPEWAQREVPESRGIWAPDLSYHDGLYYLYYSVSSFGSQHSVIGLAVNKSLDPESKDYKWIDRGKVLDSAPGKTNFNAIDPALLVDQEGRWHLFWGSYWDGLMVVEVDPATGKPKPEAPIKPVAARPHHPAHAIEAAFPLFHDGYYYLFVSWDSCCDGADSTYKVMVGRSRQPTGPFVDADGKPMLNGGGTLVIQSSERWRGPGHNSVLTTDEGQWLVHHTYDTQNLRAQRVLQIRPLEWTDNGWPRVGEPVGKW